MKRGNDTPISALGEITYRSVEYSRVGRLLPVTINEENL